MRNASFYIVRGTANNTSEDFGLHNARRILNRYQEQIPCFNDDIQGTGCVTLAAMLAALQVSRVELEDVRVVIFGSGTAGIGIADQVLDTIATETGNPKHEASKQIWYVTARDEIAPLLTLLLHRGAWTSPVFL
jgi:malic enzyme